MAWKNLKPRSLADALIVEHAALTEMDDVHALFNWSKLEAHLLAFTTKPPASHCNPGSALNLRTLVFTLLIPFII